MNFLIFLAAFIMAADENTLTRALHRPLAACAVFGAVLGDLPAGLAVGAVLELEAAALDTIRPANYILPSLAAVILKINGFDIAAAAAAGAGFWALGLAVKEIAGLICTVLLPSARKAAETRKEGALLAGVILSIVINGLLFGACAALIAAKGSDLVDVLTVTGTNGWIISGLQAAGVLCGAVGIAVLMRNIGADRMPGIYLAGGAAAAVCAACGIGQAAALVCGMLAFGAAAVDYQLRAGTAEKPAETKPVKKGGAQWW